jgi:glycosyltransferase involved in cell wall biosynthesis
VRHYARRADLIVGISHATCRDIIDHLGVEAEKVVTVYPGTTHLVSADEAEILRVTRLHGIEGGYVLFVSRLDPRKNVSRLLQAFDDSGLAPDFQLVVVGPSAWHMDEMQRTFGRLKSRRRIRMIDYVPDDDLGALYAGASFFVYPSLLEGFGLPILEAMSVGCPVLTSNVSSMPEVAGEAALYVDPYDLDSLTSGLQRMASDTALRRRLSKAGYERTQLFTWEKTAEGMIDVYRRARAHFEAKSS